MSTIIDRQRLLDEVTAQVAGGLLALDATHLRTLVDELVTDWVREAGSDADAPAVLDLLREELQQAIAGKSTVARIEIVRRAVIERRIRRLGVQTFELGKRIIDRGVAPADARAQGESLLRQIEAAAAEVRTLGDASLRARLGRDLQEASMEALYAIENKAMSHRLNHYAQNAQASRGA
jgi:hypothetical protein